jgi:hypothetical protein
MHHVARTFHVDVRRFAQAAEPLTFIEQAQPIDASRDVERGRRDTPQETLKGVEMKRRR